MVERELTVEDYLGILRRRWPLIVILAAAGASAAYGVSRFLPNQYRSQTLVMIEQPTVSPDYVRPVSSGFTSERLLTMRQEILSVAGLEPIVHRLGLYQDKINRVPIEVLVNQLRNAIDVTPLRQDSESKSVQGFFVGVTMENARDAHDICVAITSMFIEENARHRQEQSQDTTQFLGQQLADAKMKLDEQDAKLAAFKSRHLGSLPDEARTSLEVLGGLTSQLDATTQALYRAQDDKRILETMLAREIAARQASQTGRNPVTFEEQLAALQTKLAGLEARYTDSYPDITKTRAAIETLKRKILESEEQNKTPAPDEAEKTPLEPLQFAQMRVQIHAVDLTIAEKTKQQERIQQQIDAYEARIQSSPGIEQEYKELTRDHDTALAFYNQLLMKQSQSVMSTDLERRQEGEQFRVTDPATVPDKPLLPNRPLFAVGGFGGGLALGVGLVLLLEMRDTSLRTQRDVESSLRLPVLATIPIVKSSTDSGATLFIEQPINIPKSELQ